MHWHPVLYLTGKSLSSSHRLLCLWRMSIFSLWNPLHRPSVSLARFLSPILGRLHLSWQLCASSPAIWSDSSHPGAATGAGSLKKSSTTHTYTHPKPSLHPPRSHSLSLSLSHTYIYTHADPSAPVLIHKRICSSSLLVLRGHLWGFGDTLGGGARTRFTRYCLHAQPAARWKTDGCRHIKWVFCCTEGSMECAPERQQRATVGH